MKWSLTVGWSLSESCSQWLSAVGILKMLVGGGQSGLERDVSVVE